jgi:Holliday junction resolvase RusA-like endonuclease
MVNFILAGPMRSGKNAVRIDPRTGRHYSNLEFKLWRSRMECQIIKQVSLISVFTGPVKMTVRYTPGDLFRRDSTGILDALFNVLEHVRMLKDDSLVKALDYAELPLDRKNPFCRVQLQRLSELPPVADPVPWST